LARVILFCLLTSLPAMLKAQAGDDITARFKQMEDRIKALESEVATLKAALAAQPETPAPQPPQAAQPPAHDSRADLRRRAAVE